MFIVLGLSILIALATLLTVLVRRRYMPTDQEVIQLIENRIKYGMSREWDYYRLVSIKNKRLDFIRERCLRLDHLSPDEQENGLKEILDDLRARR
jgi:hypothetical protein